MRRHIAQLLRRAAHAIDPQPTDIRVIPLPAQCSRETLDAVVQAVNASIGASVGLGFKGNDSPPARY